MSGVIELRIPAVPVGQPRPRAVSFGGKARMHELTAVKGSDGVRRPHPIVAFKGTVRMVAELAYSGPPLDGPLRVDIDFVFPRTKGLTWKRKPMPRLPHVGKPDRDNCDKAVLDALKGLVWQDDAQICDGRIRKFIASGDEQPHVVVRITRLADTEPSIFEGDDRG